MWINDLGYFYYTFVTCECLKYGKSGSLFKTLNRRTDVIQDFFLQNKYKLIIDRHMWSWSTFTVEKIISTFWGRVKSPLREMRSHKEKLLMYSFIWSKIVSNTQTLLGGHYLFVLLLQSVQHLELKIFQIRFLWLFFYLIKVPTVMITS